MKNIFFQKKNGIPVPFSQEDKEKWASFKENQVTKHKVSGTIKERSLRQLRLFFGCCRTVVANTEDPYWDNEDKVKNQVKVKLQFIDLNKSIVDEKGIFHPHFRSICFEELKHMDACNFFDRAFPVLAKQIGVTVDELLRNSER